MNLPRTAWSAYPGPGSGPDPRWVPSINRCPGCRRGVPIPNHQVSPEGLVNPSVTCGNCQYHFEPPLVLEGWAELLQQPMPPFPAPSTCAKCGANTIPPWHSLSGWGIGVGGLLCQTCIRPRNP